MSSFVSYKMNGFKSEFVEGKCTLSLKIQNNAPYLYEDHDFLYSLQISDNFDLITFTVKEGLEAEHYLDKISNELERVCFNILSHTEIPINQPSCELNEIRNRDGSSSKVFDKIMCKHALISYSELPSDEFYKKIVNNKVAIEEKSGLYKEVFFILHSPHIVSQFIGLYEIMAELICGETCSQKKISAFFQDKRDRYQFIKFSKNNRDSSFDEDSFTKLRNDISHSKRIGAQAFAKLDQTLDVGCIKNLLIVINDLICMNVKI